MQRRYDLDALRIFACYLLFLFHVGKVFDPAPFYHIRNVDVSAVFTIVCGFISLWHMPLFFLLAGWSLYSSLQSRGTGGFLNERAKKLLLPFIAVVVIFCPPIKYLELSNGLDANHRGLSMSLEQQESIKELLPNDFPTTAAFNESFLEFWPTFFTNLDRFTWSHLWFVAYLMTFTLIYLPAFAHLAKRPAKNSTVTPLWIYAPLIPLAIIQITLRPHYPGLQNLYSDWANFLYYTTYLWIGFLMARNPAIENAIHRESVRIRVPMILSLLFLLAAVIFQLENATLVLAATAIAGWSMVVGILGGAARHLSYEFRGHRYLARTAFPVYLFHQPAIVFIGYIVIGWSWGITAKFFFLLFASIATVVLLLHWVQRQSANAVIDKMSNLPT